MQSRKSTPSYPVRETLKKINPRRRERRGRGAYELEVRLHGGGHLAELVEGVVTPIGRRLRRRRQGRVEGVHRRCRLPSSLESNRRTCNTGRKRRGMYISEEVSLGCAVRCGVQHVFFSICFLQKNDLYCSRKALLIHRLITHQPSPQPNTCPCGPSCAPDGWRAARASCASLSPICMWRASSFSGRDPYSGAGAMGDSCCSVPWGRSWMRAGEGTRTALRPGRWFNSGAIWPVCVRHVVG